MNKKIAIVAAAWALFQNHKKENKVFAASDGVLFFAQNHAESHAGGLEDKELFTIERDMAESAKAAGILDEKEGPEEQEPEKPEIPTTNLTLDDLKEKTADPVNTGEGETKEPVNPGTGETKEPVAPVKETGKATTKKENPKN